MERQREIVEQLKQIISKDRLIYEGRTLSNYAFDGSYGTHWPHAVCQPTSTEEVVGILKVANEWKVPVITRGVEPVGLGGQCVRGGIVIDYSEWTDTLQICEDEAVAIMSPGILTNDLNEEANRYGLSYPLFSKAGADERIAEQIFDNTYAPNELKYGRVGDYILGLEFVTASGQVVQTGGKSADDRNGYDLIHLIVGSKGTLGIITRVLVRLIPKPLATKTFCVAFDHLIDAGSAIERLLTSGVNPTRIEMFDQETVIATEQLEALGLPVTKSAILLVRLDGHPDVVDAKVELVKKECARYQIGELSIATTEEEEIAYWRLREIVIAALQRASTTRVSDRVTIPHRHIERLFQQFEKIKERYDIPFILHGHVGRREMHPTILVRLEQFDVSAIEQAIQELFEATKTLGGMLATPDAFQCTLRPKEEQFSERNSIRWMKEVKDILDPNDLLNPGRMFETTSIHLH